MAIVIKLGIVGLAVFVWIKTQKILGARSILNKDGVTDYLHIWTEKFNKFLNLSDTASRWLLITSSFIVDVVGLFIIYQSVFGPTMRPLFGLILIFGLRQLNQATTILPTPKGMIWKSTGVPSLFVTYGVSNDLFFSGHTALAVYGALEIAQIGNIWASVFAAFIVVYEIVTVIILRAHWTMDVFAGAVTALWVFELMQRWAPTIDSWLIF